MGDPYNYEGIHKGNTFNKDGMWISHFTATDYKSTNHQKPKNTINMKTPNLLKQIKEWRQIAGSLRRTDSLSSFPVSESHIRTTTSFPMLMMVLFKGPQTKRWGRGPSCTRIGGPHPGCTSRSQRPFIKIGLIFHSEFQRGEELNQKKKKIQRGENSVTVIRIRVFEDLKNDMVFSCLIFSMCLNDVSISHRRL
jgi:hypothetical protein